MVELIIDRTQYHVTLLNRLRKKPWSKMTASEQEAWYGEAAKGAYNYTDLNRVEAAAAELAEMLGLSLVTKTDWTLWDIPTTSDMDRYLSNIVAIRDACPGEAEFPDLPSTMNSLTYESANNIEKVLMQVHQNIASNEHENILGKFVLGVDLLGSAPEAKVCPSVVSGETYCGEVI